jgi:hypothetical protein
MTKKNKFLTIRRNLQNDLISQLQYHTTEQQGNHYSCYFSVHIFHNRPNNKKISSQTAQTYQYLKWFWSLHMLSVSMMVIGSCVLIKKDETICPM